MRGAIADPPLPWLAAVILVTAEAGLALAGADSAALAALALLAPGWALVPLLPARVRATPLAWVSAAPALGFAATSIALITVARVGVPLTSVSVRVTLAVLLAAALLAWPPRADRPALPGRVDLPAAGGLLLAVAAGLVLSLRVLSGNPVPGNDWAKYLLYADEIRRHGALLIDNPFWMLGVPFREDPAVPAAYGATLLLSGAPAGLLSHGILVFSVLQITTVFALAGAFWGRAAGVLAAALVAVVPASQDILGWHGLANLAALPLLALLLCFLAEHLTAGLDGRGRAGAAVTIVGLAATHRLSAIVGAGTLALVLAAACAGPGRRRALRDGAWVGGLALLLGAGVLADLYARQRTFGGTLPYTAYLGTKVDLHLAVRDISVALTAATLLALAFAAARHRGDRALWPLVAGLVTCVALAYAWVVHIPGYYARLVYFVPVMAAPLVAAVAVRLRPVALVAAVAAGAVAVTTAAAYDQAANVRSFYAFASPASLRGLDTLAAALKPGEVVVTDRCWSFLSTWLLHTRTLPALEPQDIQPKAELRAARRARAILTGTPAGRADARRLGVRFLVVDPTCPAIGGAPAGPPPNGRPVFASTRLAILALR